MKISIVATLYHSAKYINEFCQRIVTSAQQLVGSSFEIILVNDGSPDNSLDIAINIMEKGLPIIIVDLSRNFGHHKAMMVGLAHATGEQIFLLDSDLEEEPEWLLAFAKQMKTEGSDVIYGVQTKRKGAFFERYSGELFYRCLQSFTRESLPRNITTARLMSRRYVDALLLHQEREIYIPGLWHITGFTQLPHLVTKHNTSKSTYTLRRKISLLVNSITSFSHLPLVSIFYFGIMVSLFASGYVVSLIVRKFLYHIMLQGWTSVMASIWLLGGLMISFIGIVGLYLSRIFIEVKQRPYAIVRHIYRNDSLQPGLMSKIHSQKSMEKTCVENAKT